MSLRTSRGPGLNSILHRDMHTKHTGGIARLTLSPNHEPLRLCQPPKLTGLGLALPPVIHGNAIQPSPPTACQLRPACVQVSTTSEAWHFLLQAQGV